MGSSNIESNDSQHIKAEAKRHDVARPPHEASNSVVGDDLTARYGRTKRGLSGRHVQLMTLGGSIGIGLFVGVGAPLRTAGPLSVLLAYCIYPTFFIWACNMCVAEMTAHLPIRGSIFVFAARYVDPAFAFMLGWTYFYSAVMLYCAEIAAVATVMGYWEIPINAAAWVSRAMSVVVHVTYSTDADHWLLRFPGRYGARRLPNAKHRRCEVLRRKRVRLREHEAPAHCRALSAHFSDDVRRQPQTQSVRVPELGPWERHA